MAGDILGSDPCHTGWGAVVLVTKRVGGHCFWGWKGLTPLSHLPGMVEMIPNAETLRKIQVEHGVTGSFKDRPLADWLQKHNPKEDEYEKVRKNLLLLVSPIPGTTPFLPILPLCPSLLPRRPWKTSSTPAPAAAWPPTCWASVTGTTTTSCSRPRATCSTSISAGSWAMPRCSATSRGERGPWDLWGKLPVLLLVVGDLFFVFWWWVNSSSSCPGGG